MLTTSPRRRSREPPPQPHRVDVPLRRRHRHLLRVALETDARRAHPDLPDDLPGPLLRRHRGGVGDVRVSIEMKLAIVAGEASGDLHAAKVVHELKTLDPALTVFGIGGDLLAAEDVELLHHA